VVGWSLYVDPDVLKAHAGIGDSGSLDDQLLSLLLVAFSNFLNSDLNFGSTYIFFIGFLPSVQLSYDLRFDQMDDPGQIDNWLHLH
jgi:hypothetical protein